MAIKILIVEDEPLISEDLAQMLQSAGYNVVGQAYDGSEALDMIYNRNPDLVLLDISLGHQMSGLDIALVLNEKYGIPFIFITSFFDKQTLEAAKNLLPQGYIVKPFQKKNILSSLEIIAFRIKKAKSSSHNKSIEEINESISDHITPKEYEILLDVAEGLSNEEISIKHFITQNTVKTHLKKIFLKLELGSRSQLASKIFRH